MSYTTVPRPRHFADRRTTGHFHPGTMPPFLPVSIAPSAASIPGSSFGLDGLGWNPAHVLAAAVYARKQKEAAAKAAESTPTPEPAPTPAPAPTTAPAPTIAPAPVDTTTQTQAPTDTGPSREEWQRLMTGAPGVHTPAGTFTPQTAPAVTQSVTSTTAPAARAPVTAAPKKGINKGLLIGGGLAAAVAAYFMMQ